MQKSDGAAWLGLGGVILTGVVYLLLRDNESDGWRVSLTLLALLIPLAALFVLEKQPQPRQWLGTLPDPLVLLASGGVGMSLWGVSWWLMRYANQSLSGLVGNYQPPFAYLASSWGLEVIYFALLLPLVSSLLIFGVMRSRLEGLPRALAIGLLSGYMAVMYVLVMPQGLVGLLGYGLLSLFAAFLSLRTHSVWAGWAASSTFLYANLALLDDLQRELGNVGYWETRWLTLLLFCAFFTVILVQVIRFRTTPEEQPTEDKPKKKPKKEVVEPTHLTRLGWSAVIGLLLILTLYTANEMQQRNQNAIENTTTGQP